MATNAGVLAQLANEGIYGKEALARLAAVMKDEIGGGFEAGSDALQIFHGSVTALAAGGEIRTNGGVKIYAVHVDSPAAATQDVIVRFFNTSTGSIALTTTSFSNAATTMDLPCMQTKSKTYLMLPNGTEFQTAASYAVVQRAQADTAANATAAPTVTVLYANI